MKKIAIVCLPLLVMAWMSCGPKKDSVKADVQKQDSILEQKKEKEEKNKPKDEEDSLSLDEKFFMKAAHSSRFEIMAGELALKKGTAKIKRMAKMIIKDHQVMMDELEQIGKVKGLQYPRILDTEHQTKYSDLAKLEGEKFDKKYSEMMVKGHEENIKLFEDQAAQGEDKDLTKFAAAKIDVLEMHLDMARQSDSNVHK